MTLPPTRRHYLVAHALGCERAHLALGHRHLYGIGVCLGAWASGCVHVRWRASCESGFWLFCICAACGRVRASSPYPLVSSCAYVCVHSQRSRGIPYCFISSCESGRSPPFCLLGVCLPSLCAKVGELLESSGCPAPCSAAHRQCCGGAQWWWCCSSAQQMQEASALVRFVQASACWICAEAIVRCSRGPQLPASRKSSRWRMSGQCSETCVHTTGRRARSWRRRRAATS